MRETVRVVCERTEQKKSKAEAAYVANTQEYMTQFRDQARGQQESISIIRDQYRKVQEIYKTKTTDMRERLEKESEKVNKSESRRKLQLEGYGADLQNMQRKIDFYHKYIGKLKTLVEEDGEVADMFKQLNDTAEEENQMQPEAVGEEQINITNM